MLIQHPFFSNIIKTVRRMFAGSSFLALSRFLNAHCRSIISTVYFFQLPQRMSYMFFLQPLRSTK